MSTHTFAALVALVAGLLLIVMLRWAVRQLAHLDDRLQELDGISPIEGATRRTTELDQ